MLLEETRNRVQELLQNLKEKGFRITGQRRIIVETLVENQGSHFNARELLQFAQKKDPTLGFATLYRTLLVLKDIGFVRQINTGEGFNRYEAPGRDVVLHLLCASCGKITRFREQENKLRVLSVWAAEEGYEISPQSVQIYGVCSECLARNISCRTSDSRARRPL